MFGSRFMRVAGVLGLAMGLVAPNAAEAGGLVVWLEPVTPVDKPLKRAQHLAGEVSHRAHPDLAFVAQPAGAADDDAYKKLREVIATSRARWDEFEVEYGIATDLGAALAAITVIRNEADRDMVVEGRTLQGAAITRAFTREAFVADPDGRAKEFRFVADADILNKSWIEALALIPTHKIPQDRADASTWSELAGLQDAAAKLADATLDASALPAGATLWIDGSPAALTEGKATLRPGRHYLHVMASGAIAGRQAIEAAPGAAVGVAFAVDADELRAAHDILVSEHTIAGYPPDVTAALDGQTKVFAGPVFVGALDEKGHATIRPYGNNAKLVPQRPVTVALAGELGPEVFVSSIFDRSENGDTITAPGVSGGLGLEVGIYNFILAGGGELAITPGNTITRRASDTENSASSAIPGGWGGAGLYVLRPVRRQPLLALIGTYSFIAPAHVAPGARLVFGIPVGKDDGSWFRLTVGGSSVPKSTWDRGNEATPLSALWLRVGITERF